MSPGQPLIFGAQQGFLSGRRLVLIIPVLIDQIIQLFNNPDHLFFRQRQAAPDHAAVRLPLRHRNLRSRIIEGRFPVRGILRLVPALPGQLPDQNLLLVRGRLDGLLQTGQGHGQFLPPGVLANLHQHIQGRGAFLLLFVRQETAKRSLQPLVLPRHQQIDQLLSQSAALKPQHVLDQRKVPVLQLQAFHQLERLVRRHFLRISYITDQNLPLPGIRRLVEQQIDQAAPVRPVPVRGHILQPLPAPGDFLLVLEHIGSQRHLADHLGRRKGHLIPRENAGIVSHALFRKMRQYLPKVIIQGFRLLPPLIEILQARRHGLSNLIIPIPDALPLLKQPVYIPGKGAGQRAHKAGSQLQIPVIPQDHILRDPALKPVVIQQMSIEGSRQSLIFRAVVDQLPHGPDGRVNIPESLGPQRHADGDGIVGFQLFL